MRRTSATFVIFALLSAAAARAAMADDRAFERGLAAEQNGNCAAAVEAFRSATPSSNAPLRTKISYHLALCYERLGKIPDAVAAFDDVMTYDDGSQPDLVASARTHLAVLESQSPRGAAPVAVAPSSRTVRPSDLQMEEFREPTWLFYSAGIALDVKVGRGAGVGGGLELLGAEYIGNTNHGVMIVPLNIYFWDQSRSDNNAGTVNYNPIWFRRHFQTWRRVRTFLGVGPTYYLNNLDGGGIHRGLAPAGEIGFVFGKNLHAPSNVVELKILPAGSALKDVTYAIMISFSDTKMQLPFAL